MKQPEMVEGQQAWNNFDQAMGKILSVPRDELVRREKEYQRQAKRNPRRHGPKPKRKA